MTSGLAAARRTVSRGELVIVHFHADRLAGWLWSTVEVLLVLVAGVMALRRAAGALTRPPEAAGLLLVGLAAAGVLAAGRLWRRQGASGARPGTGSGRWAAYVPALAVLLLGGALTTRGISPLALAVLWGPPAFVETAWALRWLLARRQSAPAGRAVAEAESDDENTPDHVTQRHTRFLSGDGGESIAGWLRVSFQAGQRTAAAHVAFCPPLEGLPQMSVWQASGPAARLKTAQLLPHGARVDLKLAVPAAEPADVVLKFAATCPPPTQAPVTQSP